jgi:hypothetical protein
MIVSLSHNILSFAFLYLSDVNLSRCIYRL